MKAIFIFSLLFGHQVFAMSRGSSLQDEATTSIGEYFKSTDRKIRKLKWIELSLLDSAKQQYLLEAEVLAQKNGDSQVDHFHCGVFSKRWSYQEWEVAMTACESLIDARKPIR